MQQTDILVEESDTSLFNNHFLSQTIAAYVFFY